MFNRHLTCAAVLAISMLSAFDSLADRRLHTLQHHTVAPKIDGVLDEPAWQQATTIELDYVVEPDAGAPAPVRTEVMLYEDGEHLYVAFKAYDPEPEKIRASLRDRDTLWQDDNVALIIDTFNSERSGFEFFVNPLGAQGDALMTDVTQWEEDSSWDAIWDSAGQITDEGYVVEISIPFNALRFPDSQEKLTWNIAAWRNYPRNNKIQMSHYNNDRNRTCTLCQFDQFEGFKDIRRGKNFQLTPTTTISKNETREDAFSPWDNTGTEADAGIDLRWGLDQHTVLNATINPDFSQVESDANQLSVNDTYSLFFEEKRPFFLDGANYFSTDLLNLVHTRNIADPDYGIKISGKRDAHSFGLMAANDLQTNFIIPGNEGSDIAELNRDSEILIARYKLDVGERNNIGLALTDRQGEDYRNTLLSVDGALWFEQQHSLRYQIAYSDSENPESLQEEFELAPDQQGHAAMLRYRYANATSSVFGSFQDVSEDFRADLGFFRKVDYRKFALGGSHTWYNKPGSTWKNYSVVGDYDKSYDQSGKLLEEEAEIYAEIAGPKQSYAEIGLIHRDRLYDEVYFTETQWTAFGKFTPVGGLEVKAFARIGDQIDFANTQLGEVFNIEGTIVWQAGRHVEAEISHTYNYLDVDNQRLYTANLSDVRISYQFDARNRLRLVLQHTDIERDLGLYNEPEDEDALSKDFSAQLLYSYKINPQTLFFLGFSSGAYQDDEIDKMENTSKSVFAKFSYAWQL